MEGGSPVLETLLSVAVGGVIGFASAYGLEALRDHRQQDCEKKLLARALKAELEGVATDWIQAAKGYREAGGDIPMWPGTESHFVVFDGMSHRLSLLPEEVVSEVVGCYLAMKNAYDVCRYDAMYLAPQLFTAPPDKQKRIIAAIRTDTERAIDRGERAAERMMTLAKTLEAIARGC